MNTLILAHYYAPTPVQRMADHVGDSLDLALRAQNENADRIILAGVRFMAETAKLLNPESRVILPDARSNCSLVIDTNIDQLRTWREFYPDHEHVMYINSSVQQKMLADWIVTSRNVEDIVSHIYAQGKKVIFSPDRNMGKYLNHINQDREPMPTWHAVCTVHDQFAADRLDNLMRIWTDGKKSLLAHPESPLPLLERADYIGSTHGMLKWVEDYPHQVGTVYVGTEIELINIMREMRPTLVIQQVPTYTGCQCNSCPFMKFNTVEQLEKAIRGEGGIEIDYISDEYAARARLPVERMINFSIAK